MASIAFIIKQATGKCLYRPSPIFAKNFLCILVECEEFYVKRCLNRRVGINQNTFKCMYTFLHEGLSFKKNSTDFQSFPKTPQANK